MKRLRILLGLSAVLVALAQGVSIRAAEASLEGCSVTFCMKCAGDCCPTSSGGCQCLASCAE